MTIFYFLGSRSHGSAITIFIRFRRQSSSASAGAGDEIRTRDIQLGRLKLYQLSYSRLHDYWHDSRPIKNFAGSHVVTIDPDVIAEISYIRLIFRLVVGGGFEPP